MTASKDALTRAELLSDEEREAIRQAGAEDARRSRVAQGLPERIEDPAAVAVLAAFLRGTRKRAPPTQRTINEDDTAA
ncbi:MAG: hypothetical protein ACREFO_17975 [Acetobacteraceae bacterium]